jgi:hypothetical protein
VVVSSLQGVTLFLMAEKSLLVEFWKGIFLVEVNSSLPVDEGKKGLT